MLVGYPELSCRFCASVCPTSTLTLSHTVRYPSNVSCTHFSARSAVQVVRTLNVQVYSGIFLQVNAIQLHVLPLLCCGCPVIYLFYTTS